MKPKVLDNSVLVDVILSSEPRSADKNTEVIVADRLLSRTSLLAAISHGYGLLRSDFQFET